MVEDLLRENIRKFRVQSYMTQEQLAERAGVSPIFISQSETGMRLPGTVSLCKLAQALRVDPNTLLGFTQSGRTPQEEQFAALLSGRTEQEVQFVLLVVRQMLQNLDGGAIKLSSDS